MQTEEGRGTSDLRAPIHHEDSAHGRRPIRAPRHKWFLLGSDERRLFHPWRVPKGRFDLLFVTARFAFPTVSLTQHTGICYMLEWKAERVRKSSQTASNAQSEKGVAHRSQQNHLSR